MRDKWLRKDLKKNAWNSFFYGDSRERVIALCTRLGIEFTDDPYQENEMWAQIGDYLALEQEEFNRPKMGKGRPKKTDDRDVELAEQVEREKKIARAQGEIISDTRAIDLLREKKMLPKHTSDGGPKSQLSRGKRKLDDLRYHGAGDDQYTNFDLLRASRDKSCGKKRD
jgi:hypothetical protein